MNLAAAGAARWPDTALSAWMRSALRGRHVLVVGANGGVGSFAVQLAANAGATVIAPAMPRRGLPTSWRQRGTHATPTSRARARTLPRRHRGPPGPGLLPPEGFDTHAEVSRTTAAAPRRSPQPAKALGAKRRGVPTQDNLERLGRMLEAAPSRFPSRTPIA